MNRLSLAACLSLALGSAQAATFSVTRLDDPAPDGCALNGCSLREAVLAANSAIGLDVVVLATGSHVLRAQTPGGAVTVAITGDTRILGPGRDVANVQPIGRGSLFHVANAQVSFDGVTLKNANADLDDSGTGAGGAIRAEAAILSLANARVSGNAASYGGGLHLTDTALDLSNTLIESQKAGHGGGGIWARRSPIRLRAGTTMRWNSAGRNGGAIASDDEVTADDDCLLTGNFANRGGAIADNGGPLTVRGVKTRAGNGLLVISDNHVDGLEPMWGVPNGGGGGISMWYGGTVERVSLLGNQANAFGGGLSSGGGPLVIRDAYIAGNYAAVRSGGVNATGLHDTLIERVGFDGNEAGLNGGAMQISGASQGTLATTTLRNVDFHANHAPQAGALNNGAAATLTHVTFWNNTEDAGRAAIYQHTTGSIQYRNSLVFGRCTGDATRYSTAGSNLRTFESANSCAGGVAFSTPLSRGTFGGMFAITGTTSSNSGTVNAGSSTWCTAVDIRNRTRPAPCDIGAFEYGAN